MIKDYYFCHVYYPFSLCGAYRNNPVYACVQCPEYDNEFDYFCDKCGGELGLDDALSPTAPHLCGDCRKKGGTWKF